MLDVQLNRHGQITRRSVLRGLAGAGFAGGWLGGGLSLGNVMAAEAETLRSRGMRCIILWMQGGPSQFETFSPKPGHANGGDTKAIATNVAGIETSENFPELAHHADKLCVIRSMTSKEGSHPRATHLLQTGYLPTNTVKYPAIGSHLAQRLGDPEHELPGFVRVGRGNQQRQGAGLLGVDYDPFTVSRAGELPDNASPFSTKERYQQRLSLLSKANQNFVAHGGSSVVEEQQLTYKNASEMILSKEMKAFDLSQEPDSVQKLYGSGEFAKGCLLARRLVETGVACVEVELGNWDTHFDNFNRCKQLAGQLDKPFAGLLSDLQSRGMLEKTLVVCMGEFGRTPKINPRTGRDHYPRAFNVAVAGGGIQGGQVIGETSAGGDDVTKDPIEVTDFLRTLYHTVGIDSKTENMSGIGRPIKIVDGGEIVPAMLG